MFNLVSALHFQTATPTMQEVICGNTKWNFSTAARPHLNEEGKKIFPPHSDKKCPREVLNCSTKNLSLCTVGGASQLG